MSITWTFPVTAPNDWANIGFGVSVSHSFTGMNGGTAYPSGCTAICAIATRRNDMGAFSSVTIGGVAATLLGEDGTSSTSFLTVWGADLPSGGTDTVVATTSNTLGNGGLWSVFGALGGYLTGSSVASLSTVGVGGMTNSSTATQTIQVGGSGANTTIALPSGGIGLAFMYGRAGVAATSLATPTWSTSGSSNITASGGDLQNGLVTNPDWLAMGNSITAGSWGPLETSSPANASNSAMVAVTFNAGVGAIAKVVPPPYQAPVLPFILF